MADIGSISSVSLNTITPVRTAPASSAPIEQQDRRASAISDGQEREPLKDVIAVSEDGDTVQASKAGTTLLEEDGLGTVVRTEGSDRTGNAIPDVSVDRLQTTAATPAQAENETSRETAQTAAASVQTENETSRETAQTAAVPAQAERTPAAQAEAMAERLAGIRERAEAAEERAAAIREENEPQENPVLASMKEAALAQTNGTEEGYQAAATSYASYTDQELERLYLRGDISRFDYEQEIESRKDLREATREEERVFAEGIVRVIDNVEQTARTGQEITDAFSPNASDQLEAAQRISMISAAENPQLS